MSTTPNIAFFGTSRFAVIILDVLRAHGILPALIVTQPNRPQGRNLELLPSPAKIWATKHSIPVLQPETLTVKSEEKFRSARYDLAIVASYGTIISKNILDLFPRGALNVHPSLLPKYRGASPLQSAILADDKDTGVTVIALDEKMDHGPIVAVKRVTIKNWPPNTLELEDTLATAGGDILATSIMPWLRGEIIAHAQDDGNATFTKKISKSDGELHLADAAYRNYLKIQAYTPWPGTYFFCERHGQKMRVKVTKASYRDGQLTIERIIPEGGHDMAYQDFLRNS